MACGSKNHCEVAKVMQLEAVLECLRNTHLIFQNLDLRARQKHTIFPQKWLKKPNLTSPKAEKDHQKSPSATPKAFWSIAKETPIRWRLAAPRTQRTELLRRPSGTQRRQRRAVRRRPATWKRWSEVLRLDLLKEAANKHDLKNI